MRRNAIIVVLLCGVAVAGGGDYVLRSLLLDGGLSKEQADTVLALPRNLHDIMTADENHPVIPPTDLVLFDPEGEYLLILHITDTIRITRIGIGSVKKVEKLE